MIDLEILKAQIREDMQAIKEDKPFPPINPICIPDHPLAKTSRNLQMVEMRKRGEKYNYIAEIFKIRPQNVRHICVKYGCPTKKYKTKEK